MCSYVCALSHIRRYIGMKTELLEIYSGYLLSSFGQTTATGLYSVLDGASSHDQVTRFLNRARL